MTTEVTSIALKVDSTEAKTAEKNLLAMGAAGKTAADALTSTEASAKTAGDALAKGAAGAAAMGAAQGKVGQGAKAGADALRGTGAAAALTANQTAQLSAQLQDLFVQVQSGGSPLTALIQQGSQLSAVFGGVGPALRAVGTVLFSVKAALAGVALAGVGLGAAFLVGQQQSVDLARSLTLSGNAAGLTEGQFNSLSKAIAAATNSTIGSTRDTLAGLAGSGRITSETLTSAATAAQLLAKATGQSADEIVKDFVRAADAPARFAQEQNRAFNFLSSTQLKYIQDLDESGRKNEALAATLALLVPRLQDTTKETTGLASAFGEAKRQASAFLEALQRLGRKDTVEERIAAIKEQLAELEKAGQKGYLLGGPNKAQLLVELDGLNRVADAQAKAAAAQEQRAKKTQAEIAFNVLKEQSLSRQEQLAKALGNANAMADSAGASDSDRAKVLDSIRLKFSAGENKALLQADLAGIRSALDQRVSAYKGSESILEALRSAALVTEREFYDAKRGFVALDLDAQVRAYEAEIARLRGFKGSAQENIEVRKQIAEAQAKLTEAQAAAASKNIILSIQEASAQDVLRRAYIDSEIAAKAALVSIQRRAGIAAADVGLGDQQRARLSEQEAIAAQFTVRQASLEADFRNGRLRGNEAAYRRELTLLIRSEEEQIAAAEAGYQKRIKAQENWQNGAQRALENYRDGTANVAGSVDTLFTDTFKGLEDVLVKFATTGKLTLNDLFNNITAGLVRIAIQQSITKPLAEALLGNGGSGGGSGGAGSVLSSLFSSFFGGGRATGGEVQAGRMYEINERGGPGEILNAGGRQYLLAAQSGSVATNSGGGLSTSVTNVFNLSGPADRRTQAQVSAAAGQGVQRALARDT